MFLLGEYFPIFTCCSIPKDLNTTIIDTRFWINILVSIRCHFSVILLLINQTVQVARNGYYIRNTKFFSKFFVYFLDVFCIIFTMRFFEFFIGFLEFFQTAKSINTRFKESKISFSISTTSNPLQLIN